MDQNRSRAYQHHHKEKPLKIHQGVMRGTQRARRWIGIHKSRPTYDIRRDNLLFCGVSVLHNWYFDDCLKGANRDKAALNFNCMAMSGHDDNRIQAEKISK